MRYKLPTNYEHDKKNQHVLHMTDKEKAATAMVLRDYNLGERILERPYIEYNHRSIIEEANHNQKMFNTYVEPRSTDPVESWRAQTKRPIVRNKLVAIVAHVTKSVIYPAFFAQNRFSKEDQAAGEVMRLLSQWIIENSNYEMEFVNSMLQAVTDPATIVKAEYLEIMRKIKEKQEDGSYTAKEVVDKVMSGFFYHTVRVRDLLISNVYENNIQRQRFVIHREFVDYSEAKQMYGSQKNFTYVSPGIRYLYSDESDLFYSMDDKDTDEHLVERVCYYNRYEDLELTFINGILVSDPDQPMRRRDKLYPFAKGGYEPLNNGRFFYYKSAANKLGPDEKLVNTLYNMTLDGTVLQLMPPMALYGQEEIGSDVMIPGMVTAFEQSDTKLESIAPRSDLRAGLMATEMVERSITESSQENLRSGMAAGKEMTAREVAQLEENAKVALGLFDKQVRFIVKDLGLLMVGDIKQYLTIPDIQKLQSEDQRLEYGQYLLKGEDTKKNTEVRFTGAYNGRQTMSSEEIRDTEYELQAEEGDAGKIYLVNPVVFSDMEYKVRISPDVFRPKSESFEWAKSMEVYDRAVRNPVADIVETTKTFLFEPVAPGESERFIQKQQPQVQSPGAQGNEPNNNLTGQITSSNALSGLM